jgi:predicted MFS family arabinose efflux permease
VLGELRAEFHINGVIAALHGSTFGIGLLASGVWGVGIVDRIGRRTALMVAAGGVIAGVTLFCLGPVWPVTLLGTAVAGLSGALLVMVMPGLISDHHGEHRATAFAAVNAVPGMAGLTFSMVIGAVLGAGGSWRVPYLVITGLLAAALAVVALPVKVPPSERHGTFSLGAFREREVLVPWLHIVNAVLTEFTIGVWCVTYLKEVGDASAGTAAVFASVFGVMMFVVRLLLPPLLARIGRIIIPASFLVLAGGAVIMCLAPGLPLKVLGLTVVGIGGGPLYPLTVDRFYERAGHRLDSVSLGAFCALASGAAVTTGPLAMGALSDAVDLRWAILVVPALAVLGAVTQRPRPRS